MRQALVKKIASHMEACAPREGCGFIVHSGKTGKGESFIPVENKLDDDLARTLIASEHNPDVAFLIDPKAQLTYAGTIGN